MNLAVETENSIVLVSGLIIYTLNPRSVFKYDVFGKIRGCPLVGYLKEWVDCTSRRLIDTNMESYSVQLGGGRASGFPPLLPSPAPPPLYLHNHPLLPLPKTGPYGNQRALLSPADRFTCKGDIIPGAIRPAHIRAACFPPSDLNEIYISFWIEHSIGGWNVCIELGVHRTACRSYHLLNNHDHMVMHPGRPFSRALRARR